MNTDEINEEALATLHELAEGLPRCKRCGALAIGEFAGSRRVIGRKAYGENWTPYCECHPMGEGVLTRMFAYHRAAERYNRATAAMKEMPRGS
jgi:hypothetical protein